MNRFVLDTSVAIAWYLPEVFSVSAREWQERMLEGRIDFQVPSLHFWEFGNVLRTYLKRGELDAALCREIYDTHLEAPLKPVEPERRAVLDCALKYDATVYDAVYIASSILHEVPLLTAEKTTTPWVVRMGSRIESVRS